MLSSAEAEILAVFAASILILAVLMYFLLRTSERPRQVDATPKIISVVKCGDGGEVRREYRDGDHVGQQAPDCPGGVVVGVYREVRQEEKHGV